MITVTFPRATNFKSAKETMSQTITIQCESCDAVLDAVRQLNSKFEKFFEKFLSVTANSNGKPSMPRPKAPGHDELLTIPEFAARVKRSRVGVYKSISRGAMPAGSVVYIHGGAMRINWTLYCKSILVRPV